MGGDWSFETGGNKMRADNAGALSAAFFVLTSLFHPKGDITAQTLCKAVFQPTC